MAQLVFEKNSVRFRAFIDALDQMVDDPNIPVGSEEIVDQLHVGNADGNDKAAYTLKVYENGEPSTLLIETRKYLLEQFDKTGDFIYLKLAYDTFPEDSRVPDDVFTSAKHFDRFAYRAFREGLPPEMFALKINKTGKHPELQKRARFMEDVILPTNRNHTFSQPKSGAYITVDGDILYFQNSGVNVYYEIMSVGYPEVSTGNALISDIPYIARIFGAVPYDLLEVSAQDHEDAMQAIIRNDDILQEVADQFKHDLDKIKGTHWFIHEVALAVKNRKNKKNRNNAVLDKLKELSVTVE